MVASWPPSQAFGGGPTLPTKSFATVVAGEALNTARSEPSEVSTYRSEPAPRLSRSEMLQLAEPFRNALVGRFAYGCPSMEQIRKFIIALGLKGDCPVGLLDAKHVLLRPTLEEDYTRLLCRHTWYVWKAAMVISKWFLEFRANQESSIVPV